MAGARKAAVYLTVGGVTYAPGDEVPAEVAELVDAPGVFEETSKPDEELEPEARGSGQSAQARRRS